jgi:hypothetical protein
VVKHLTKSGTILDLLIFLPHLAFNVVCIVLELWNANIPSYCIKMLTLVGFDVMCNKLEWMKIHGSNGNGLPLVQRYTEKNELFFGSTQTSMSKMA